MISAQGYETLVTHVFIDGDKYLDSDVVFGAKDSLVRPLERRAAGTAAGGRIVDRPYAVMEYDFALAPRLKTRSLKSAPPAVLAKSSR